MQNELHRRRVWAVWRGAFSPPQFSKCTAENAKNVGAFSAVKN
jgi:hypothetical protein